MSTPVDNNDTETELNKKARKVNVYNQMKCPKLIQNPMNVGVLSVVDSALNGATNYMIAYPFSGVNPDYPQGAIQPNGFYEGPDQSMSSNYFAPIGLCDTKTSTPDCAGKRRWVYIRNIPTGKVPLFFNANFHDLTGCNMAGLTEGRGLAGGLAEDISDIQPFALLEAAQGKGNYGSFTCKPVTYPVGSSIYDMKMQGTSWDYETKCSPSYHYLKTATTGRDQLFPGAPAPGQSEGFKNYPSSKEKAQISSGEAEFSASNLLSVIPILSVVVYSVLKNMA